MTPQQTTELAKLKGQLVSGMESYMKKAGEDCGYAQADIDTCMAVVDSYVAAVAQTASLKCLIDAVQVGVVSLNKLNEKCNGGLIETDQREVICEIINKAAKYAGFAVATNDLTEKWREW